MSGHYDRTAFRSSAPGRLYGEWRTSPVCSQGHDLTARGARVFESGKPCCRSCRDIDTVADAVKELRTGIPSTEILDEARCNPENAALFEPITRADSDYGHRETQAEGQARHRKARAFCDVCPVKEKCFVDALKYKRVGVYGGVSMSERFHRELRSRAQGAA